MPNQQNEESLMEKFRQGDHDAFRVIFKQFYASLCHFANMMIEDHAQAEDIVSDAFRSLWAICQQFKTIDEIKISLYRTTADNCQNHLKSLPYITQKKGELLDRLSNNKDKYVMIEMIQTELYRLLCEEIESLPEEEKAVYKLYYFQKMPMDEIAGKLNMPLYSVEEICNRHFKK